MKRDIIHRKIAELDADRELKQVLKGLISFADEEDERTYGKMKQELEEVRMEALRCD